LRNGTKTEFGEREQEDTVAEHSLARSDYAIM